MTHLKPNPWFMDIICIVRNATFIFMEYFIYCLNIHSGISRNKTVIIKNQNGESDAL